MSGTTLGLPPSLVMRDVLLSAFNSRRLILFTVAAVMALSVQLALWVEPPYQARSSLLVLMGSEHAFRPAAGQPSGNTGGGIDAEQVLRTEAAILASADLHRTVIKRLTVEKLYPRLLAPPGWVERWFTQAKAYIGELSGQPNLGTDDPAASDPLLRAIDKFASDLSIAVDRKTSVIGLAFTHPDRTLSADALRLLEEEYFPLRAKLFNDVQAPIVHLRQEAVGKQLAEADAALARFKKKHDIANFSDRRAILMRQQGELEASLTRTEGMIAELQARLTQLNQQLTAAAGGKKGAPVSAAAPLQSMVQTYRQRQEEAQTTYRGSLAMDEARRQMLERESDIAKMRATQAYSIQSDRNRTDADLRGSLAVRDATKERLGGLIRQIEALNREEIELLQLERNRSILEDNYKSVSKMLDERQVMEAVAANRQSSVRVVQPPLAPADPQPIRRLILAAGVIGSVLLTIAITLLSHFFRASYLRPEALEFDTGLAVLTTVPETRALGRSNALISPGG
jgi:uncharacterized protein involved in exopolysaccharide biosynthesis